MPLDDHVGTAPAGTDDAPSGEAVDTGDEIAATPVPALPPVDEAPPRQKITGRLGHMVADMFRNVALIGAVLAVLWFFAWQPNPDPVREVDPLPIAFVVADAVAYPVLVPTSDRWRATAARYEPTTESGTEPVWFTGGVWDGDDTFAGVSQSLATAPEFIAEQTLNGTPSGSTEVAGRTWERFQAGNQVSLVATIGGATTVVSSSGDWADVEAFAATLRPVQ